MLYLCFAKETINWFKSYLSNRTQVAEVNGKVSGQEDMLLGVPQGSILGLILFLIYVNDINRANSICEFTKFADDTTLLTTGCNLHEPTSRMNDALQEVDLWFKRNKLNLNLSKTRYMLFNVKTRETDMVKIGNEYPSSIIESNGHHNFIFKLPHRNSLIKLMATHNIQANKS